MRFFHCHCGRMSSTACLLAGMRPHATRGILARPQRYNCGACSPCCHAKMVDGAVMLQAAIADPWQRQYPGCRAQISPCTMFLLTVCVLCIPVLVIVSKPFFAPYAHCSRAATSQALPGTAVPPLAVHMTQPYRPWQYRQRAAPLVGGRHRTLP